MAAGYMTGMLPGMQGDTVPAALVRSEQDAAEQSGTVEAIEGEDIAQTPMEAMPEEAAPLDEPDAPRFDVVRVEEDGSTLVAGAAEAGSTVSIRVNDEVVAEAKAGRDGKFASFVALEPSDAPRVLTLNVEGGEIGRERVIVAPVAAPAPAAAPVTVAPVRAEVATGESTGTVEAVLGTDLANAGSDLQAAREQETVQGAAAGAADAARDASENVQTAKLDAAPDPLASLPKETATRVADSPQNDAIAQDETPAPSPSAASELSVVQIAPAETPNEVATAEVEPAQQATGVDEDSQPESTAGLSAATSAVQTTVPQDAAPSAGDMAVASNSAAQALPEQTAAPLAKAEQSVQPVQVAPSSIAQDAAQAGSGDMETTGGSAGSAQAPLVMLATETGVRVLQSPNAPKPEALTQLLGAISYDAQGEVNLTGVASGAFVRIYIDNAPISTSRIEASGNWQADLPFVDTGVYTLRVDELDAQGDVVGRVETPFKRESQAALSAATSTDLPIEAITVQPGATLWAIARDTYGSGTLYTRLYEANKDEIRDPDLIYPGQVFALPQQ